MYPFCCKSRLERRIFLKSSDGVEVPFLGGRRHPQNVQAGRLSRQECRVASHLAACWRTVRLRAGIKPRRSVGSIPVNTRCPQGGETELQKVGHTCGLLDYRGFGWQRVWLPASRRRLSPRHRRRQPKRRSRRPSRRPPPRWPRRRHSSLRRRSRQAAIEQEQAAKVPTLHPYVPIKGERIFNRLDTIIAGGGLKWHPFFVSAYSGGGFTLGAGYNHLVSSYNTIDARGQLHHHRLQTRRGRVPRTAHVQPPRQPVAPRRLARGHASRLLRYRDGHVEGRQDQLPVPAAVRLSPPHHLPEATELHAAGRRRVLDVVAGARRGDVTIGGDEIHAG